MKSMQWWVGVNLGRAYNYKPYNKGGSIMKKGAIVIFIVMLLVMPGPANAVSEEDFKVQTTQDLINLCTVSSDDPLYHQSINFCHGYLVGAYHYYVASSSGPKGIKLVCPPDPPPSRNETIRMFIDWAEAHPQYMKEKAVETEFRFLMETWPCK
jgi:hypothetical protein